MTLSSGSVIAPTDPAARGPGDELATVSWRRAFWPTPLRKGDPDPDIVGSRFPASLIRFVLRMGVWDQIWLSLLSLAVSFLGTIPIDIQRRIVNEALKQKDMPAIAKLAMIYAGLVLAQGLTKLLLNMYRSWVGANSIRVLRTAINSLSRRQEDTSDLATSQGVKVSMIVAESDAIGGFVGDCIAEPVLQASILVTVFGYMLVLQPTLALVSLLIFAPQMVFVPLMQRAINRRVQARIAALRQAGADVIAEQEQAHAQELGHEGRFREVFRLDMGIFRLKFTLNFLMNISTHMGNVAILALGAWFVVNGRTEVGTVVAFLSGLANINDPWGDLVNWYQNLMVTSAKYELVRDAASELLEPERDETPEGGPAGDAIQREAAAPRETRVEKDEAKVGGDTIT